MADSTSASVEVAASPDAVLDVIADLLRYPEWAEGVTSVSILEIGRDGRPLRARFEVSSNVVNGWYTIDYTWSDRAVSWDLVESPLLKAMEGRYDVEENDGGTTVTYTLRLNPAIPLIGPLRRKAEQQVVRTALQDLAARAAEVSA